MNVKPLLVGMAAIGLFGAGCAGSGTWGSETTPSPEPQAVLEDAGQPAEDATADSASDTAAAAPENAAPTPTAAPAPKPAVKKAAPKPASAYVTMTDTAFSPQVLAVKPGTTVIWTNKSTKPHTVRADSSNLYDSGNIAPGATYKRVFEWPGSYVYYSASDTNMKGTIVVR